MTDLLIASTPVFEIEGEVKGELARDTVFLEVSETTSGLKTLALTLLAFGPASSGTRETELYLDGAMIDFGKSMKVSLGPGGQARTIFEGAVSGLEVRYQEQIEPKVCVFAEDKLMSLRMTRRMKTYENVTDADIAQAIAQQHQLAADVDADGPSYKVVQQWNQSDLAFLRQRARLIQADVWIGDGKLCFQTRDKRSATEVTLVRGNDLVSVQVRADLAHQRTKVSVSGYDAQARDVIHEEADASAIQAEISGGRTGVAILEEALGVRDSFRVRETPMTSGEASAWARAEMLRRARAFVTVTGVTRGTPDLTVGSRVTLELCGDPFNGSGYYTTLVRHTFDTTNGHRTYFEAERATVGAA
jgi:phage protein D